MTDGNAVRKITLAGVVTTLAGTASAAGSADGTGAGAFFQGPLDIAAGNGKLYVSEFWNRDVREVTLAGVVTRLAGSGNYFQFGTEDGTGAAARFAWPSQGVVDAAGNLFVPDYLFNTIRRVTPSGVVTTPFGTPLAVLKDGTGEAARFRNPAGIATDSAGTTYVADRGNGVVRKVTAAGVVTTLVGNPNGGGSFVPGTGAAVEFDGLGSVALSPTGDLYVTDLNDHVVVKVTQAGVASLFAGAAGQAGSADGQGAAARFNLPSGLAVDGSGNVWVGDSGNATVRRISPSGTVTTVGGVAGSIGTADGPAGTSRFTAPLGMAVGSDGNVYVADGDAGNSHVANTVRKITPALVTSTVAGTPGAAVSVDGTGAAATFTHLNSIAADGSGHLWIADRGSLRQLALSDSSVSTPLQGAPGLGWRSGTAAFFDYSSSDYTYVSVGNDGDVRLIDPSQTQLRRLRFLR